jgi:hypothetical protein
MKKTKKTIRKVTIGPRVDLPKVSACIYNTLDMHTKSVVNVCSALKKAFNIS